MKTTTVLSSTIIINIVNLMFFKKWFTWILCELKVLSWEGISLDLFKKKICDF